MREVVIVPTGVANLASVRAALGRLRAATVLARRPEDVEGAARVVLPGVGRFAAGMEALAAGGYEQPLRARVLEGRPTLAVCLGLHLLASGSEESPGVRGLGAIDLEARRFEGDVRVPQLGWNVVRPATAGFDLSGAAYFAHSYRLVDVPEGWDAAVSEHGGPFVAALWRKGVLACQFHPELSGAFGARLVGRWLEDGRWS